MLCYVVVFVLLLYYKLVGMHSISLDGCCMSCTWVQTFIEKKKKKKNVFTHTSGRQKPHLTVLAFLLYEQ